MADSLGSLAGGAKRGETLKSGASCKRIRVLLADDHPVVLRGLSASLRTYTHLEVLGEARDGLEAVNQARKLVPDVVVMDYDMPLLNGLAATETLQRKAPQVRVLILSAFGNPEYVRAAAQSGARGYLLKDSPIPNLIEAIETIHRGECYFSSGLGKAAVRPCGPAQLGPKLSKREQDVLTLIAEGFTTSEIAARFAIGSRTVETHRQGLMRKLDIHSVAGLTRYAVARGLVTATA